MDGFYYLFREGNRKKKFKFVRYSETWATSIFLILEGKNVTTVVKYH